MFSKTQWALCFGIQVFLNVTAHPLQNLILILFHLGDLGNIFGVILFFWKILNQSGIGFQSLTEWEGRFNFLTITQSSFYLLPLNTRIVILVLIVQTFQICCLNHAYRSVRGTTRWSGSWIGIRFQFDGYGI